MLSTEKIEENINPDLRKSLPDLHILNCINSTNIYILNYCNTKNPIKSGFTCLAEQQTAGRGQWGKTWVSPYASHIYLSMLWQFPSLRSLSGLSLVIGIIIVRVLKKLGIKNKKLGLKWPNDVYWGKEKLAGILIETSPNKLEMNAVIGIGLNIHMPKETATLIDQPWTDLQKILKVIPSRNIIAGLLITELLTILPVFTEKGFELFLEDWKNLDINYQKPITIRTNRLECSGIGKGVNMLGELIIQDENGIEKNFKSGEVLVFNSAHRH